MSLPSDHCTVFAYRCLVHRHRETIEPDTPKTYRVIKRAQSYEPNDDGPLAKRRKIAREQGTHEKDRIYARRTASLRRADSLRSVLEDNVSKTGGYPLKILMKLSRMHRVPRFMIAYQLFLQLQFQERQSHVEVIVTRLRNVQLFGWIPSLSSLLHRVTLPNFLSVSKR